MSLAREDRDNVNAMHQVANGTGGSGASEASRKRSPIGEYGHPPTWKNPPFLIHTPSSQRHTRSTGDAKRSIGTNPYQQNNFNSLAPRINPNSLSLTSKHKPQHASNPVRSDAPSAKKRKLETLSMTSCHKTPTKSRRQTTYSSTGSASNTLVHDGACRATTSGRFRSTNGHADTSKTTSDDPLLLSTPATRPVIDVDDEEDLGVPISNSYARFVPLTPSTSSDDLHLITSHGSIDHSDSAPCTVAAILEVGKPSDQHAFSRDLPTHDTKPPPSAGPHTCALKAQSTNRGHAINGADNNEKEPIEDADEFDNIPRERNRQRVKASSVYESIVRRNLSLFESKVRPPELDLKSLPKRKRVSAMKGKVLPSATHNAHTLELGKPPSSARQNQPPHSPALPSLTTYKTTNGRHREYVFPLEACAYGSHIVGSVNLEDPRPKLWLRIQDSHVFIVEAPVESGPVIVDLELGRDICNAQLPRDDATVNTFPLIAFTLSSTNSASHLFIPTKNFGNQQQVIIFKPLTSHENWSSDEFHELCDDFKSNAKLKLALAFLDAAAFRSLWNGLRNLHGNTPADRLQSQVSRRRPQPRPIYAAAAEASSTPTGSEGRRSKRQMISNNQTSNSPSPLGDEIVLLYPPSGTGAVNVTNGDLKRLEPGEFLNDTLIELGLKLWLHDLRCQRPEFADQVHVFSSFFYTQLNQKHIEEGYQNVRKWTSKFDLFQKKYIIVPINEHLHWYLAIICHPELALQQPPAPQMVKPNVTTRRAQESLISEFHTQGTIPPPEQSTLTQAPKSKASSIVATTEDEQEVERAVRVCPTTPRTCIPSRSASPPSSLSSVTVQNDNESAMVVIPATDSEGEHRAMSWDVSVEPRVSSRSVPPSLRGISPIPFKKFYLRAGSSPWSNYRNGMEIASENGEEEVDQLQDDNLMDVDTTHPAAVEPVRPEQPYIFSFDSLGTRHPHALKVLSRYLDMEAKDKKGWADIVQPVIKSASVPAQPNFCDCGVYLLHFVEQFMSDPDFFSQQILHQNSKKAVGSAKLERERLWNHDKVAGRRQEMKQRVISLSTEWKREKQLDSKGKGKDQIDDQPREVGRKSTDPDSDIEVVEMSPKPIKSPQPSRINKAARLR